MKLIVCGGRNYHEQEIIDFVLNGIHATYTITEIVHGGASGVDACANVWADNNNMSRMIFEADWRRYGRSAGPIRNSEMAEYADGCIAFPGGRGTNDMAEKAVFKQMQFWDFRQLKKDIEGGCNGKG